MKSAFFKAGMVAASVFFTLLTAEILLRIYEDDKVYVWQPYLKHLFYPDSSILPGVSGEKHFTINKNGIRGEVFTSETDNYLCIGGSTTECLYLDDTETWWKVLQDNLRERGRKITIGSIGKSGSTTVEHYLEMKYFVPQVEHLKGIILMCGLNDMMKFYARGITIGIDFQQNAREDSVANIHFLLPDKQKSAWRRLRIFQLAQSAYHHLKPNGVKWLIQDDHGKNIERWRKNRQYANYLIEPTEDFGFYGANLNLSLGASEFEKNLNRIIDEAEKQHLEIFFINQAALYKDTMSAYENSLLWMGGIGNFQQEQANTYYSTKALRLALMLYNYKLMEVARQEK